MTTAQTTQATTPFWRAWLRGRRRVLPGFWLGFSYLSVWLGLLLFLPLAGCLLKVSSLGFGRFFSVVWTERVRNAYLLTIGTSFAAATIDTAIGLLLAWVLVRYEFPGKKLFDALIDLPLALPTVVAGLVYSSLYADNGWFGAWLNPLIEPWHLKLHHSREAIVLVMMFIGLPFGVRTVQPVLESIDADWEEAAASLGASRWQIVTRVLIPTLLPAMITGFALTFARCVGEYGSVVLVSGNIVNETEIAAVLIYARLEANAESEAAAISLVLLGISFGMLAVISFLERWSRRHEG